MSGVQVIVAQLKAHAPLTAIVPAARIMAGEFPQGTAVPAISITQISSVPMNMVSGAPRMHTDRVEVTVLVTGLQSSAAGTGYPGLRALLKLVLAACPHFRGSIAGVSCDSIQPDTEGPDLYSEEPVLISGSRDFIVRWRSA
ncbi:MAG: DUF3168 domain-containing protein [Pseudomonadota bacterium]